ncbi:MAG: 3-oxoacyl-[acyl-carrier-protein] synthase, partial [Actinomycetota bacterium]
MPAIPHGIRGAVITGWGVSQGSKRVTNHDLEQTLDTNDEWITERTGIMERWIGGSTAELSSKSGRAALEMA